MFAVKRCISSVLRSSRTPISTCLNKKHTLPELPYAYDALEPIICKEIMELHHKKHHQTYVNNLNALEEKFAEAVKKNDVSTIIALEPGLRFNGGGHINHSIFWKNLSPNASKLQGELCDLVVQSFGSVADMQKKLATAANGVQGSGWAWLGYNKATGCLEIATTPNQDPLLATKGLHPLFGIDVWEHAYYLQYLNVRADYTKAIFDIVNWDDVNERYLDAKCDISR
ncbi:superoxide dismutase [Mn], mitochondrial isoform X1 [Nilaparvata lugens]|uniref:superoxide dismutase [Mn], mitochondrial isoform X1 n=1 Tax=Nilaparvata lugens TaxID=108931 RepID=UPI00193E9AAB|nr:superoxide dismutase [Mn], mitochondrial isoform X1 [Nilaparvata lugens]